MTPESKGAVSGAIVALATLQSFLFDVLNRLGSIGKLAITLIALYLAMVVIAVLSLIEVLWWELSARLW